VPLVPLSVQSPCCAPPTARWRLPPQDLFAWFSEPRGSLEAGARGAPAVYVVGFQEFVDLNARSLLTDDVARRQECKARVETVLQRLHGGRYLAVQVEQLVGALLLVFVRPQLAPYVKAVFADTVKTGAGGLAGNKGGVSVRLELCGASLCVINSHLPAGQSHPQVTAHT
jgi:hypothetical protein